MAFGTYLIVIGSAAFFNPYFIDANYNRLTVIPEGSVIFGTSRAAQGIVPEILDDALKSFLPFNNQSFTLYTSPYGPTYLDYIKRNTSFEAYSSQRLFILTVDPWSLRQEKGMLAEDFNEAEMLLGSLVFPNHKPNMEYLTRYVDKPLTNAIRPGKYISVTDKGRTFVDFDQQWLSGHFESRLAVKLNNYRDSPLFTNGVQSETRMKALVETIEYLSQFGQCMLVRMPFSVEFLELENEVEPEFDSEMQSLAESLRISYFSYASTNSSYQTTDGNHLHHESGDRFSRLLAKDIKLNLVEEKQP
jgi:hypothetical protein